MSLLDCTAVELASKIKAGEVTEQQLREVHIKVRD